MRILLASILFLSSHALAGSFLDIPNVTRGLNSVEFDYVAEVIVNRVQDVDPVRAKGLINKLSSNEIKVWLRAGWGFTSPALGLMAFDPELLSTDGIFRRLGESAFSQKPLRSYTHRLMKLSSPSKTSPAERERMLQVYLASMLIHEYIHTQQGRRYAIVGDIAVAFADRISTVAAGLSPMELEAYEVQRSYVEAVLVKTPKHQEKERKFYRALLDFIDAQTNFYAGKK
jgi:hypothetical protein